VATNSQGLNTPTREALDKADKTKLRVLWAGVCLYVLIMVNALTLANKVPYQALIVGGLINAGIIVSMFVAMNKIRRRMNSRNLG